MRTDVLDKPRKLTRCMRGLGRWQRYWATAATDAAAADAAAAATDASEIVCRYADTHSQKKNILTPQQVLAEVN
jgi:hypothetical protein